MAKVDLNYIKSNTMTIGFNQEDGSYFPLDLSMADYTVKFSHPLGVEFNYQPLFKWLEGKSLYRNEDFFFCGGSVVEDNILEDHFYFYVDNFEDHDSVTRFINIFGGQNG